MRNASIIFGCIFGGIALSLLPMDDVAKGADDLILVFTIMAGLLCHMIALTASIFEPGRMSADGIREVGADIRRLQTLNIGLFAIYLGVLATFVLIGGLHGHPDIVAFALLPPSAKLAAYGWSGVSVGVATRFLAGALMVLAIIRTFRTLFAIRALQVLRTSAQARDAESRDKIARERDAVRLRSVPDQGGAAYGDIIEHGSPPGKRKKSGNP